MPSQWKFVFENHNRRDRGRKGDYREALREESLVRASEEHLEFFRDELKFKEHLIARFERGMFFHGQHCLCLDWSLADFVRHNRLHIEESAAKQLFDRFVEMAERDNQVIVEAIRAVKVHFKYDDSGELKPCGSIKARLICDEVKPSRTP